MSGGAFLNAESKMAQDLLWEYAERLSAVLPQIADDLRTSLLAAGFDPASLSGTSRIARERARQVVVKGWSAEHDDEHADESMALAAACYAAPEPIYLRMRLHAPNKYAYVDPWPWRTREDARNSPSSRVRLLEKAGALCAAEIDRWLRCGPC